MRTLFVALFHLLSVAVASSYGQDKMGSVTNQETKGVCSPIAPDNHGTITITCTGFSEQQNKQLLDFLHKLSAEQSKDQDLILKKLDELIAAVREAQSKTSPRTISDETQRLILRSAWGMCEQAPVLIIAPSGDDEAGALAVQLRNLLTRAGRNSSIAYKLVKKGPAVKSDIIIAQTASDVCVPDYLTVSAPMHLSMAIENPAGPDSQPGCDGEPYPLPGDPKVTRVFVCPR